MASFEICEPQSLEEALGLLDPDDSTVRAIGGGTAMMLMMKAQVYQPTRLVSLRQLKKSLSGIALSPDGSALRIGALTTFAEMEHSPLIRQHFPVITAAMHTLANVRVRNVATIGGNLAHGDPHLDMPPIWVALDAKVRIVGPNGERVIPVDDIFVGYYETTLANNELIVEVEVPLQPTRRARYVKVTTRAAHDWPALGLTLSLEGAGRKIDDARLVLSAAVDRPLRLTDAENALRGATIDDAVLQRAVDAARAAAHVETDSRGSAEYKQHLLGVHLKRAVEAIVTE